jgi:hypothetical protein
MRWTAKGDEAVGADWVSGAIGPYPRIEVGASPMWRYRVSVGSAS